MYTLPNGLSLLRMALVPVLLILAWRQDRAWLMPTAALALATDALDGVLARSLGQCTELGRRLDSWADFALYMSSPLVLWWYAPAVFWAERLAVTIAAIAFAAPVAIGFIKYRRLTMYHTWSAKVMGWAMGVGALSLLMGYSATPLRIAVAILVVSAVEEIAITLLLPRWQADVPTLWHAWNAQYGAPDR
jgi:CDP-diacylglycerol--glycerol-3-phosphate 3-phosphatidyltransferase